MGGKGRGSAPRRMEDGKVAGQLVQQREMEAWATLGCVVMRLGGTQNALEGPRRLPRPPRCERHGNARAGWLEPREKSDFNLINP